MKIFNRQPKNDDAEVDAEMNAPDIMAAITLANQVRTFAAGSADRSELSDADTATLAELSQLADALAAHAPGFKRADEGRRIQRDVAKLVELHTANEARQVAGVAIASRAIEDAGIRKHLAKFGAEIAASCAAYAATRRADIEAERARLRGIEEMVKRARNLPIIGHLTHALEQAAALAVALPGHNLHAHAVEHAAEAINGAVTLLEANDQIEKGSVDWLKVRDAILAPFAAKAVEARTAEAAERDARTTATATTLRAFEPRATSEAIVWPQEDIGGLSQ